MSQPDPYPPIEVPQDPLPDPEPLPDGHPLWALRNAVITPHTANTLSMARPAIVERLTGNVRRWGAGEELIGIVDLEAGY